MQVIIKVRGRYLTEEKQSEIVPFRGSDTVCAS